MALPNLSLFIAALTAAYLLPGPDMAMIVSTSLGQGVRSGLLAALGLAASRSLHVTLSALGLATLFHAHPLLFDGVRWIGAAYLAWLGWKVATGQGPAGEAPAAAAATSAPAGWTALGRGFLTNLLNPKALMFCALLLPQFIVKDGALLPQYLLLGIVLVLLGAIFDVLYVTLAARFTGRVLASGLGLRLAKTAFGGVFGLAALRLALGDH